jgi:hypothetical protein
VGTAHQLHLHAIALVLQAALIYLPNNLLEEKGDKNNGWNLRCIMAALDFDSSDYLADASRRNGFAVFLH